MTPRLLNTSAAGQNPVNEAWIRFSPTSAVKQQPIGAEKLSERQAHENDKAREGHDHAIERHRVLLLSPFRSGCFVFVSRAGAQ